MYLIHRSTMKQRDGTYTVGITIVNKKPKVYNYQISSEFAVRRFESLYRKGKGVHGYALATLNKFKIRD